MQRKNFSHRGRLPFVINQLIKRRRCAAPEWLKIKRVPHTKQSDNRLSVRLSNTLLSGYRFILLQMIAACGSSYRGMHTPVGAAAGCDLSCHTAISSHDQVASA
ncbi:hypothetical protein DM828_15175 [Pseudomonas umsongensis]|nr:hypothetical protein [Pseudomonas umsongensis]